MGKVSLIVKFLQMLIILLWYELVKIIWSVQFQSDPTEFPNSLSTAQIHRIKIEPIVFGL